MKANGQTQLGGRRKRRWKVLAPHTMARVTHWHRAVTLALLWSTFTISTASHHSPGGQSNPRVIGESSNLNDLSHVSHHHHHLHSSTGLASQANHVVCSLEHGQSKLVSASDVGAWRRRRKHAPPASKVNTTTSGVWQSGKVYASVQLSSIQHAKVYATSNSSINFTHVEYDPLTGTVYVGAVNWIFQLNADSLRVEHAVKTGPIRDSVTCAPTDCAGVDAQAVTVTNAYNKVLLVEPYSRMLIVCGSVHQGACARHRLEDISLHEEIAPIPVAANDQNSTTIAFVGPARYFGVQLTPILYVAASDTRLGPYRDMVPAISGRSLEAGSKLFNIIDRGFADSARIDISTQMRDYFTVRYVYGFYSGDYVYFAQVQRKSYLRALEEYGYVTRLSRVCLTDAGFHTYTEVTLECVHDGLQPNHSKPGWRPATSDENESKATREEFNLLQDAYLIKAGSDLADSMGIERGAQVLLGVFANNFDHTARAGSKSAVCVFPMAEIEQRFAENIHLCYNGSVELRNMDYIAGSVNKCPGPGMGNVFNFCNEAVKLNGSLSVRANAAVVYKGGTVLTAIAGAITGQHTIALAGTNYGALKKILLHRADYGEQFDEVSIDANHHILADLHVDADTNPRNVIVSSPYKVVKLPVETCSRSDTCDECLQARNPYCGWCSLQKRCTIKSECLSQSSLTSPYHNVARQSKPGDSHRSSTPRWLSLETSQCIDFQAIRPEFMARDVLAPVELLINQLPALPFGAKYLCVFDQSIPIQATVTRTGLSCNTPALSSRPSIPNGQDHAVVNLAVRSSETDTDFIHRSFVLFDCSVHKSCKSCVLSTWGCNWCMHENTCSHNATGCTRRMITNDNHNSASSLKGVQHCPSFRIEQDILVPDGARRELSVQMRNMIASHEAFECIAEIEHAKQRVPARVRDNNVVCGEMVFHYEHDKEKINATLTIVANGDTLIDRANFTVYKCAFLGSHAGRPDCSLCHTRGGGYGCVWCGSACSYVDQCADTPPASSCPPPRIDYIHPISGPVEGGTLVSIEGSNLGSSLEEIRERVSIGGIPCKPVEYNVSIRVVCQTGASPIGPQSALVVVGNRAGVTRAQEKFQYKIIELNDVSPKIGPQSGGTRIYLNGKNLNIGSRVSVHLDDRPCHVERALASNSELSCRTSSAPYPSYVVNRLHLSMDHANLSLATPYLYTNDPTIHRIEPLHSLFSGGNAITVTGSHFNSIQQPRMIVFAPRNRMTPSLRSGSSWPSSYNSQHNHHHRSRGNEHNSLIDPARFINDSACTILSAVKMVCPSPVINSHLSILSSKLSESNLEVSRALGQKVRHPSNSSVMVIPDQVYLQLGFLMDDTVSVLQLDSFYPHLDSSILYVSDPIIYSLSNGHGASIPLGNGEGVLPFKNDVLIIEGDNMNAIPLGHTQLNITVGTETCNISSIAMRQIVCQPPLYSPPPTDELGRRSNGGADVSVSLPSIVMRVGNIRRHLGYLHYGDYYALNGFSSDDKSNNGDDATRFYHQNPSYGSYGNRFDAGGMLNIELLVGGLILAGTVLALVSVLVLIAYNHKTNQAERDFKRIQLQMDTLENNVRHECKQAFAELQTDILHATGLFSIDELHRMSVPTHDERTYLVRFFFGSHLCDSGDARPNGGVLREMHQTLNGPTLGRLVPPRASMKTCNMFWHNSAYFCDVSPSPSLAMETTSHAYQPIAENLYTLGRRETMIYAGLNNNASYCHIYGDRATGNVPPKPLGVIQQFEQLLLHRDCLLNIISTLEQQKTFTIGDRMRFASLLSTALLDKMDYSFDVMRQELSRLIDRLTVSKHAQHLMRKPETIGEKMLLNWMAVCMHKYTKEVASGPLFLLHSAIKHQIDKGPVDFVTGNSKYCLSEDRLLREQIDYKTITVQVLVGDPTISHTLAQAKQTDGVNPPVMAATLRAATLRAQRAPAHTLTRGLGSSTLARESNPASEAELESNEQGSTNADRYQVRLLDCDSISQVKSKIIDTLYRAIPHSRRPGVCDVALYWRCLKPKSMLNASSTKGEKASDSLAYDANVYGGCVLPSMYGVNGCYNASRAGDVSLELTNVLLQDYDHSTQILTANEAIWRRLNTVGHYAMNDGAQLILYLSHDHPQQPSQCVYSAGLDNAARDSVSQGKAWNDTARSCNELDTSSGYASRYAAGAHTDSHQDELEDTPQGDYHLYESIPAVVDRINMCDVNGQVNDHYGGSVQENVYNLSTASSILARSRCNEQQREMNAMLYTSAANPYGNGMLLQSSVSANSCRAYRMSTLRASLPGGATPRRSLARNVYDRLASFMPFSRARYDGLARAECQSNRANMNYRLTPSHCAGGGEGEEAENGERHNVWHLVKPSSLIADCIVGASGASLYDDDSMLYGRSRHNIRTMRQRRAMRQPRGRKHRFTLGKNTPTAELAAAAAALSASQVNLSSSPGRFTPTVSSGQPVNASLVTSPSSLVYMTNSASSFFGSLFHNCTQASSHAARYEVKKSIPEIYLTRLLSTKGTIQQYVDDLYATIFSVNEQLPIAVKWLFDYFDTMASNNSINDTDTVNLWKTNTLVTRFWASLVRCPEFMLDVGSTVSMDSCLQVLVSNLIDACTNLNDNCLLRLGKESPSSKLLFARDMPAYQEMMLQYYKDVACLPAINEADVIAYMHDVSNTYAGKVNKHKVLGELLCYCVQYKTAIFNSLANDPALQMQHMHLKFEAIAYADMVEPHDPPVLVNCNNPRLNSSMPYARASAQGLSHV